ncbi:WD40-repeat-containing domain protein [Phycomyces nitens]|nr:WD40-repeat-containing domain protein [Phycomyces nitens]
MLPPHNAAYVKVKSKSNLVKRHTRIVLAQVLTPKKNQSSLPEKSKSPKDTTDAVWTMKFSKDGQYMASGGKQCVVYVWKVLSNPDELQDNSIKVFKQDPFREYYGHTSDVLDISWSKSNFLLSSSMDKTVRLWHVTRQECLCVFKHLDIVTGIDFHPRDDRYFISGSLDCKVRLWSIPDKNVSFWNELPSGQMITAVGFARDGNTACVGSYIGCLFFYETQGLKYNTQISLRTKKGRKGKKITGIEPMPGCHPGQDMLLVTSNDSRIRLINMKDKSLLYKYTGAENVSMLIKASFSDDGKYIVCGSENFNVYIWKTEKLGASTMYSQDNQIKPISSHVSFGEQMKRAAEQNSSQHQELNIGPRLTSWFKRRDHRTKHKRSSRDEHFEAHDAVVTSAIFAPTKTRQMLASTNKDIIYNNTPVYNIEEKRLSIKDIKQKESSETILDDQNTPLYENGHIIVSADCHGFIKVWRMDSGIYMNSRPSSIKRYSTDASSLAPSLTMSNIDIHEGGGGASTSGGSKKRTSPFTKMFPSPSQK